MLKSRFPPTESLFSFPLDVVDMDVPFYSQSSFQTSVIKPDEFSYEMPLEYTQDPQPNLWNPPLTGAVPAEDIFTGYSGDFAPIHPMLHPVPIFAPAPRQSSQPFPLLGLSCSTPNSDIFSNPSDVTRLLHDDQDRVPRTFIMKHKGFSQQSLLPPGNSPDLNLASSSLSVGYASPAAKTAAAPVPHRTNHSSTPTGPPLGVQNYIPPRLSPITVSRQPQDQRSARRQALVEKLGFTPVDPDRITTHEKKRLYLECLEEYVHYLQRQIQLYGSVPVALEKSENVTDNLTNESIRTLLIHMQMKARAIHEEQTRREDQLSASMHPQMSSIPSQAS